jgi:tetratricopeptide (TPR) repeat protein
MKQARHISAVAIFSAFLIFSSCQSAPGPQGGAGSGPIPVPSPYQKWADVNGDNMLDEQEINMLVDASLGLLTATHDVLSPVDGPFDGNGDGFIDENDLWCARFYFQDRLNGAASSNPEINRLVDYNDDGIADTMESYYAMEYVFVDPVSRAPHEANGPIDPKADVNKDGVVDGGELFDYGVKLVRAAMLTSVLPVYEELIVQKQDQGAFLAELQQGDADRIALEEKTREAEQAAQEEAQAEEAQPEEQPAVEEAAAVEETVAEEAAVEEPAVEEAAAAEEQPAEVAAAAEEKTASTAQGGVDLTADIDAIFPVFHKYYDDHPIGTAVLKNDGDAAMEKIKVQLIVKGYMTEKKTCKGPDSLAAGMEGTVDLYALFTKDVLDISEPTKALANISISYTSGGQAKSAEFVETVNFLNRNNMTWDDDSRVAAFVTKNDKSVLMFRSSAVTIVDEGSAAVDSKFRTAMAIHESLRLYGMKYWSDPKSSFATLSKSDTEVDYLQFPEQTLQLKTGDCDDLSILYSALLEASSVNTAFITVPGHIFIAFQLDLSATEAKSAFLKPDNLILLDDDTAWVPLEVTSLKSDFLTAWETGAKEWREAKSKNQEAFIPFSDASKKYAPVGFSSAAVALTLPSEKTLTDTYKSEVKKFISQEIATQVATLAAEIKKNGGKAESVNKLGVLYARYGLLDDAETQFTSILKTEEYVPALVNMGNISFLTGSAKKALQYYQRAEKKAPDKAVVLLGIARANHELENYGAVSEAYTKLKSVDSQLASNYSYLDLRGIEATKAASIAEVTSKVEWDTK